MKLSAGNLRDPYDPKPPESKNDFERISDCLAKLRRHFVADPPHFPSLVDPQKRAAHIIVEVHDERDVKILKQEVTGVASSVGVIRTFLFDKDKKYYGYQKGLEFTSETIKTLLSASDCE